MSSDWDAERSLDYRVKQTLKFLRLALWLTWRASPRLLIGILLLIGLEALFAPVMLILSKTILDSLALRSGLATAPQPVVAHFSLEIWISLAAVVLAASNSSVHSPLLCMAWPGTDKHFCGRAANSRR